MHLQKKVQLTVALPIILLLAAFSLASYFYLHALMRDDARQQGMLVVQKWPRLLGQ